MAFDSARGVAVLFGGFAYTPNPRRTSDETFEWNGIAWTQRLVTGPSARDGHAMVYDSARAVTVLYGGYVGVGLPYSRETWEWDGASWSLRSNTGPLIDVEHAMVYDSARGVTVLFGGYVNQDRTWEWDGVNWINRLVSGPSPRAFHSMSYDSVRQVTVLFGGFNLQDGSRLSDTWEWDGTTWSQLAITGPSARKGQTMSYDSARGVHVLFGGSSESGYEGDTWELGTTPSFTSQPNSQIICASASTIFAVSAAGSGPISYQWQWKHEGGPWTIMTEGNTADEGGLARFNSQGTRAAAVTIRPPTGSTLYPTNDWGRQISARCQVTTRWGSATSAIASLTVCPADFDCDNTVDFFDYDAFVSCFEGRACPPGATADFDGDGSVDFFDYDAFVVAFESPC